MLQNGNTIYSIDISIVREDNETILLNSATVIILDPTIYQNNVCCFCGKQAALRATSGLIGSA